MNLIPQANLPTQYWSATIYGFSEWVKEHCALVFGDISGWENILCRIHSSCLTGDTFHSLKCDCGEQLDAALQMIADEWWILIYLAQEWRDIGLLNKIRAYSLQDEGFDTVDANEQLGLPADNRQYKIVKEILEELKIQSLRLITNNPLKIESLEAYGIMVTERVSIVIPDNEHNKKYLQTKKDRMRHEL